MRLVQGITKDTAINIGDRVIVPWAKEWPSPFCVVGKVRSVGDTKPIIRYGNPTGMYYRFVYVHGFQFTDDGTGEDVRLCSVAEYIIYRLLWLACRVQMSAYLTFSRVIDTWNTFKRKTKLRKAIEKELTAYAKGQNE